MLDLTRQGYRLQPIPSPSPSNPNSVSKNKGFLKLKIEEECHYGKIYSYFVQTIYDSPLITYFFLFDG